MRLIDQSFHDVDSLCAGVQAWDLRFDPLSIVRDGSQVGRIIQHAGGGALLAHARFNAPLVQQGAPPSGQVTFVVPGANLRALWWRGHDVEEDQILVFPEQGGLHAVSGSDFEVHTVSVPETLVGDVAQENGIELDSRRRRLLEVFRVPKGRMAGLRRWLGATHTGRRGVGKDDLAAFVACLLPWWYGDREGWAQRIIAPPGRRARAMRVCLEAIEEGDPADLTPERLWVLSGVSERTLQYAFRERFGLTPALFLKRRRMAAVRRTLKEAAPDERCVGDVFARHGFWHTGQSARDYRCLFGELPSETLAR